jgi:hypothetical protein
MPEHGMLHKRTEAVLRVSTLWAFAWMAGSLALVVRVYIFDPDVASLTLLRIAYLIGERCAEIGFVCGVAFCTTLLAFGRRDGRRNVGMWLGASLAAAIAGAISSPRLRFEPSSLSALVFGGLGLMCAAASLAIGASTTRVAALRGEGISKREPRS